MRKLLLTLPLWVTALSYGAYEWHSVQIRGGGYVPGVQFHPNQENLAYIRTDVGGTYKYQSLDHSWLPLNDAFTDGNDMGSIAIAVDAENAQLVYSTGGLYTDVSWCGGGSFLRSANQGQTWTKIPLTTSNVSGTNNSKVNSSGALCLAGNGEGRGTGNRIAARGQIIYLATNQNGLLKSSNQGTTWETIGQFGNTSGISAVQFDKDGNIYATPYRGGLYYSADGQSWSQLGSFNDVVYQMSYNATAHVLWLTTNGSGVLDQNSPGSGKVYRADLSNKTATQITMPSNFNGFLGIQVNPRDAQQIAVSTGGTWSGKGGPINPNFKSHEGIFMSTDGGKTWKDIIGTGTFDAASAYYAASSNPHWISALGINPFNGNHITFGTGYGMWSTFNAKAEKPEWIFTSTGIEETVPLGLASTTFGAPLVSVVGDVDGFYHSDLNQPPLTRHKLSDGQSEAGTNYDIAWAYHAPQIMVRVHKDINHHLGAYSDNGGQTWTDFASHPQVTLNAWGTSNEDNYIALSADGSTIVWNMTQYGVFYSNDQGKTWVPANTPASELAGFRPVADKVNPLSFYLYNISSGKLYASHDKGKTWTMVNQNLSRADSWAHSNFTLATSPAQAGELWVGQGAQLSTMWFGDGYVWRSTDGGANFTKVSGLKFGKNIAFGKGSGATPAIYVVGADDNESPGVFRSEDQGQSWTRITDDQHQYGGIDRIAADPCIYSRIYISGSGRGIIYGQEPGHKNTSCTERIDFTNSTPTTPRAPSTLTWQRQGNLLTSAHPLTLRNLQGQIVARSSAGEIDLSTPGRGLYLLNVGNSTTAHKILVP